MIKPKKKKIKINTFDGVVEKYKHLIFARSSIKLLITTEPSDSYGPAAVGSWKNLLVHEGITANYVISYYNEDFECLFNSLTSPMVEEIEGAIPIEGSFSFLISSMRLILV